MQAAQPMLQYLLTSASTECESCHTGSTVPHYMYKIRLGMGMVRELWALPCWTAAPAGKHESQGWGQARLIKAIASVNTHVGQVWKLVRLSCYSSHGCVQELDRM